MKTALILFAHGARDAEWAAPMRRVQAAIRSRRPDLVVELAFLEFMSPALPECGAKLIADGIDHIVVLPMFIAQGGHLKRELPEMLAAMRAAFPAIRFSLATAIGEHEAVVQAMADAAMQLAAQTRD